MAKRIIELRAGTTQHSGARIRGMGNTADVAEMWEWFSALAMQNKPVEYVYLPEAAHQIVKPWECVVAQDGICDRFRFWLKNEEDPDPAKTEQYKRWRELRKLQEANAAAAKPN